MSPTKPKRMDGYIRVSRVGTRDVESESYITEEVQREKIEQWAALRGVQIVAWHVDRDQSGSKLERPGFDACMQRIRDGKTEGIVVAWIDRLSRADVADALMIVRQIHDDYHGLVASVDLGIDPTTEVGEMLLTVLLALARMQWRRYRAAWEIAKTRAINRGAHVGPTPLGYIRADDSQLVPDPSHAPAIREAFRIAATKGLRATLDHLRESGLPQSRGATGSRQWDTRAVRRLISNRVYLGEIRYGESTNHEAHEPLVDLATWTQANKALDSTGALRYGARAHYPLSGQVYCNSCGGTLSGSQYGRGARGYRCRNNHRIGEKSTCEAPALIGAGLLEEYVQSALLEHVAHNQPCADAVLVPGGDVRDVELAESSLRSAELARTRDATDIRLREVLGDEAFFERMEAHNTAVDEAQQAYEKAVAVAQPEVRWPLTDEVATATAEELPALLERCGLVVRVKRGQGNLPERVALEAR